MCVTARQLHVDFMRLCVIPTYVQLPPKASSTLATKTATISPKLKSPKTATKLIVTGNSVDEA